MPTADTDINARILLNSQASRLLREAQLGSHLVRCAHVAAAIHMAQSADPRNEEAQFVPRPEGGR